MSNKPSYERIAISLGDARRDAAEMGDYEMEILLRDVQAIAVDRIYTTFDQSDSGSIDYPPGKRRLRVLQ